MSQKQQFNLPTINYNNSFDAIKNISGLTLALDYRWGVYTDTTMTALAGVGQAVKGWRNRATDAYHATEAANPPTLAADGLQFDGANDVLRVARMTGQFGGGFSWFLVGSITDGIPATTQAMFGGINTTTTTGYFYCFNFATTGILRVGSFQSGAINATSDINTFSDGQTAMFLAGCVANPSSTLTGYFNGSSISSASLAGFTWSNLATEKSEIIYIGARQGNDAVQSPAACKIRSLIIYNRPLSAPELTTIHRYLGHAHGIAVP